MLQLTLTEEQDKYLHEKAFNTNRKTKTVSVEVEALQNLLVDFGKALDELPGGYLDHKGNPGP